MSACVAQDKPQKQLEKKHPQKNTKHKTQNTPKNKFTIISRRIKPLKNEGDDRFCLITPHAHVAQHIHSARAD